MSVRVNILPPVTDFKILFVTWSDWGFFVFAATAADISGVAIFKPGLIKLFQAFFVPRKIFCNLLLIEPPSSIYWCGVKVIIFWQIHLGLGHLSCSFNMLPWEFKSVHAEFDIAEQCLFLHLPFFIKSSPRVIYLVKIWLLLQPQIAHFLLIILTSFLVLGFIFSYTFSLTV